MYLVFIMFFCLKTVNSKKGTLTTLFYLLKIKSDSARGKIAFEEENKSKLEPKEASSKCIIFVL